MPRLHVAENAPVFTYDRPLTQNERDLMNHISMWGSAGYPVSRVGSRHWSWQYRDLGSKVVFPTKREAVESFEDYLTVLGSCLAAEAYRKYKAGLSAEALSYGVRCRACDKWETACTCEDATNG